MIWENFGAVMENCGIDAAAAAVCVLACGKVYRWTNCRISFIYDDFLCAVNGVLGIVQETMWSFKLPFKLFLDVHLIFSANDTVLEGVTDYLSFV